MSIWCQPVFIRRLLKLLLLAQVTVWSSVACVQLPREDVSRAKPFRELVGREFRINADGVYAYGIRDKYPERQTTSITLMSGAGIAGRFVAFKQRVEPGSVIRVVSVWRSWTLAGRYYYCVSEFENTDRYDGLPVMIDLDTDSNGNVGLDSKMYVEIAHR